VAAFRDVRARAPDWIPGMVNLPIALMESAQPSNGLSPRRKEALDLLDVVRAREPNNLHGHFVRGLLIQAVGPEFPGYLAAAHAEFRLVSARDPFDGMAWYFAAGTLPDKDDPNRLAGPTHAQEILDLCLKAIETRPYLTPAYDRMTRADRMLGRRGDYDRLAGIFEQLNRNCNFAAPGEGPGFYGEFGRYARAIELDLGVSPEPPLPPRFDTPVPIDVVLHDGHRWASESDVSRRDAIFGRALARFGLPIATLDVDGDGDLFVAAAVHSPRGLRDILLLNRGDGQFGDATDTFGIPPERASLGIAAADFDADGSIGLFLCGAGDNRLLLHNRGGSKGFERCDLRSAGPAQARDRSSWASARTRRPCSSASSGPRVSGRAAWTWTAGKRCGSARIGMWPGGNSVGSGLVIASVTPRPGRPNR
jgi:hypothetical protein